jgi:prolyl oligopeptidase
VFNVYSIPLDGGEPRPLTRSAQYAYFAVSYFPEDDRFLFTADRGGDELNHLYVQAVDGTVTDLAPGEKLKAMFAGWSEDRRSFWVLTNERDPKFFDLYRYRTEDYSRELVYRNDTGYIPGRQPKRPMARSG